MTGNSLLDQAYPLAAESVRTFRDTGVVHLSDVLDETTVKACESDDGVVEQVLYSRRLARIAAELLGARSVRLFFARVPEQTDWPLPPDRICIAGVPLDQLSGDVTFARELSGLGGCVVVIGYLDADIIVTEPQNDAQRMALRALLAGAKVGQVPDTPSNPVLYRAPIQ